MEDVSFSRRSSIDRTEILDPTLIFRHPFAAKNSRSGSPVSNKVCDNCPLT